MNSVRIRPAAAGDRSAVLQLLQQEGLPVQDLVDTGTVRLWVAEDGGRLLGAAGLEPYGDTGLLRSLVVAPPFRGRGIGQELVAALEHEARLAGVRQLVLLTQTAQPFFQGLGYSVIAREQAPGSVQASAEFRSLCPASAVCMSRFLESGARQEAADDAAVRVLFLCTGNSCRSILAEATFNHLAPAGWLAMSAGSQPTGTVHPRSLALLAREGIPTDGCRSKSWDGLPATPDIVITVCSSAAGETCPAYLGQALRAHWGVDDPARAIGTDAQVEAAFDSAYRTLRRRIEAFFALPLAELKLEPARLKAGMDRIGAQQW